jgi:hypothetical protein
MREEVEGKLTGVQIFTHVQKQVGPLALRNEAMPHDPQSAFGCWQ